MQKYQEGLEEKKKEKVNLFLIVLILLHHNLHKISLNRVGSYMHFPQWLKNEKATINPKNNEDKCFQYAVIAALNYQNIKKKKKINKEYQK